MSETKLSDSALGRDVEYPDRYDSSLLFPIDRAPNRETLHYAGQWIGADIWNAYEISWLNLRGRPQVAIGRFVVPADSPRLIESKSFKLYLNSFNEERYETTAEVAAIMRADLSRIAGGPVEVHLEANLDTLELACGPFSGECLDDLEISVDRYLPDPGLLRRASHEEVVTETLFSNLLKSNCPVTGQPDWGSVQIGYTGPRIDRESLLKYIISFRRHTEFHEHCVERMYCDIQAAIKPESLFVMARYTRRGGLDINPWRSSAPTTVEELRNPRQ